MDIVSIITIILGFGFIFYYLMGEFSLNPKVQFYNKLFDNTYFIKSFGVTLIIASLLLIRYPDFNYRDSAACVPIVFVILIRVLNLISHLINRRNLIICTRWDKKPREINFLDYILSFILLICTFSSFGLLSNLIRFGYLIK